MTDPYQAAQPPLPPPLPSQLPRPPRPWTVTVAAALMLLVILLSMVSLFVGLANTDATRDAIRRSLEDNGQSADEGAVDTAVTVSKIIGFGITLLIVAAFVVLAIFVLRGINPARIITWVLCGVFFLCGGFGLVSTLGGQADYLPGGYVAFTVATSVLSALLYLGIIALLALPASSAYFKPNR